MTTPPQPLHVAHAVIRLDVGGLERIVLDLIRTGRRAGQRVTVVCLEQPGTLAAEAEAAGAAVVALDKPPGRPPETAARAAALLADLRPDVLHTHQAGPLWYLGPAAAAQGAAVLHTEHIDNVGKETSPWRKLRTRVLWQRAARHAGLFCCVSADIARSAGWLGTVPAAKLDVVLNGIDVDRYAAAAADRAAARERAGVPAAARVVGSVGRLNEVKRQDLLLRAVARLGPAAADAWVLLVGDGPERGRLEALAGELGLAARTRFAGYQARPELFLPAMDVFALTSRLEGLPLALLEAWAAGLPAVATAVGGVPAVVADGQNGLLVPSGDEPAVAAAVGRLLADRALAATLAAAGQAVVRERYSLDRMAAEYEARYRRLIAARAGGG